LPKRISSLLLSTFLFSACAPTGPKRSSTEFVLGPFNADQIVYVSTRAGPNANGTKEDPFADLSLAIGQSDARQVVISGGDYPEITLKLDRPMSIIGTPGNIDGPPVKLKLTVDKGTLALQNIHLQGALKLRGLSQAYLHNVKLTCDAADCTHILDSRVEISDVSITAPEKTARVCLIETSTVHASKLQIDGGNFAQILARKDSRLDLKKTELKNSNHSALILLGESRLKFEESEIQNAKEYDLLINRSEAFISRLRLGKTKNITVGIQGGTLSATECEIEASPKGGIKLLAHNGRLAQLTLRQAKLDHSGGQALSISGGHADIQNTRFTGTKINQVGEDVLTVWGALASLNLQQSHIENSAGFGISFYEGGHGTVSATITRPRLGGILSQSITSEEIKVYQSRIENCDKGNGITVLGGDTFSVDGVIIQSCAHAGVLAGEDARMDVKNVRLIDNRAFGLAAFGGAQMEASNISILGSKQNKFASCGEMSQVLLEHEGRRDYFCP